MTDTDPDETYDFRLLLAAELGTLQRFAPHLDEAGLRLALGDLRLPSTRALAATAGGIEQLRVDLVEVAVQRLGELTGAGPEHFRERVEVIPDDARSLLDGPETAPEPDQEPPYPEKRGRGAFYDPDTGEWRPI